MLRVESVEKAFNAHKNDTLSVLCGVSFELERGDTLAIAGDSGCGKSTLARIIIGLTPPDGGNVFLDGTPLWSGGKAKKYARDIGRKIQLIPQSPYASLDPSQRVGGAVCEAVKFAARKDKIHMTEQEAREKTQELFRRVQLEGDIMRRLPRDLSGGQAQRVVIARALALSPEVLISDEATSMLDVVVQARIMALLRELNEKGGLSVIYISHDTELMSKCAARTLTIKNGALN